MVLGQSAGMAACLALEQDRPVQQIDFDTLQQRLKAEGQVLSWPATKPADQAAPAKQTKQPK
jgi:hypothetical protein